MTRYSKVILVRTIEYKLPFVKKIENKYLKLFFVFLFSFLTISEFLSSRKKLVIPYLELAVTERCSLNCKNCANLMQYYEKPEHYSFESLKDDVDALEIMTRKVMILQILGGEPLIYPQLFSILSYVCEKKFIKKIQLVTNGTVMPSSEITELLKNKKITVIMSDYGDLSRKKTELISLFKKEKINYNLLEYSAWMDYGDVKKHDYSKDDLFRSYNECAAAECKTLLKGKIFTCPRAAHLYNLGILSSEGEFIDIKKDSLQKQKAFYNQKTVSACEMCIPLWLREPITPAIQMPRIKSPN